ncbi:MAG: mandelate racemase/muconate lactonizing enzyme family protein, partial [Actinomycetota bacterium]|nr:mandelate racemase/muconate lactonizing enzyme family protein [Actinomycetota bacterium]
GLDVADLGRIHAAMDAALRGHAYAKSPLDIACFDALGRLAGLSVTTFLGGMRSERFPLYMAVPLAPVEEMAEYVRERRAEGIRRFQLKVGADPSEDAERVRAALAATAPGDLVIADANGAWRLQDAVVAARLLEPLERVFLEQPCATLEECLVVRERTTIPMVLDEAIQDVPSLLRAYEARALEAFNLKISKVGGLGPARLLRDLGHELGLRVTIEDTWGGDLTTAAVAHLAASTSEDALFTVSFMNDWTKEHVAGHRPRSQRGWGAAPRGSGLGVEVDVGKLGEPIFSVESPAR